MAFLFMSWRLTRIIRAGEIADKYHAAEFFHLHGAKDFVRLVDCRRLTVVL